MNTGKGITTCLGVQQEQGGNQDRSHQGVQKILGSKRDGTARHRERGFGLVQQLPEARWIQPSQLLQAR